jgi:tetratricopeptide (TPR) repeat protein
VCAFVERKYDIAEGHLLFALGIKDDLATAWHLGGDVYRMKGEETKAVDYYTQAIRYDMDNAMAFLQLGNLLMKRGDWVSGLKALRSAQIVDDRKPQLDRMRPGLRAELDEQVKKMLSPQPSLEAEGPAVKDEGGEQPAAAPSL